MNRKLKCKGVAIGLQEVPDEVSLIFNISGCPYRCSGCHSEYLWEYDGDYLSDTICYALDEYKTMITCVCFMGGDQNEEELISYCELVHGFGLKTCLYTGSDEISFTLKRNLDYYKVGPYIKELGGLDSKTTNQRFYETSTFNKTLISTDRTYKFSKEYRFKTLEA